MQPQEQRTDAVAQSAQQPRSQSPNLQSKDGDRAQPTHGGCTPCKTAYRLVEGPPEFFLATNPSDEQLAAFKAFVESAMAIRHEVLREGAEGTGRTAEAAGASSSQTRPKAALLSRTVGRPGKGGTPAAGDAVASVSADAAEPANAPAAAPESGDAYPEVPELAGSGRLLRYLQGFDYDVPAASDAYRRHMKWREEMGLNARRRRIVVVIISKSAIRLARTTAASLSVALPSYSSSSELTVTPVMHTSCCCGCLYPCCCSCRRRCCCRCGLRLPLGTRRSLDFTPQTPCCAEKAGIPQVGQSVQLLQQQLLQRGTATVCCGLYRTRR